MFMRSICAVAVSPARVLHHILCGGGVAAAHDDTAHMELSLCHAVCAIVCLSSDLVW